jgi:uncharacterized protein (DUF952 family)
MENPCRSTLHLAPEPVWAAVGDDDAHEPESFAEEGFVHCTNGEALVIEVANRYYRDDLRSYLLLDVDLGQDSAPAVFEDEARQYPHIYGPIDRQAIIRVRRVERAADGTFTHIGDTMA